MSLVWKLVRQELRILLSDKKALGLLFLMPTLLIVFLTFALKNVYEQKVGKNIEVIFLTNKSQLSQDILTQFASFNYKVSQANSHLGINAYLQDHQSQIVIEIPENISGIIKNTAPEEKIKMYFDPSLDKSYGELVKSHFLISLQAMVIDQVNRKLKSQDLAKKTKGLEVNSLASSKNLIQEVGTKTVIPNPIQQTVPAWALFAMFFIALPMASSLSRDRDMGILKRLLCYNIRKPALLLGKIIPYILINNLQFYLMLALGLYVVPSLLNVNFSMGPVGPEVLVVSFVCSLAATSYGLLVATLANSNEQASSLGALMVVIMALFGGVMIPHFVMPGFMQTAAYLSPLYWGLEAFLDLFLRGQALVEMAPRLLVLLAFSMVAFVVSLRKFRWSH